MNLKADFHAKLLLVAFEAEILIELSKYGLAAAWSLGPEIAEAIAVGRWQMGLHGFVDLNVGEQRGGHVEAVEIGEKGLPRVENYHSQARLVRVDFLSGSIAYVHFESEIS